MTNRWSFFPRALGLGVLAVLLAMPLTAAAARAKSFGGLYAFVPHNQSVGQEILSNPDIDGIEVQFAWMTVEPSEGRFDWSGVDAAVGVAARAGKKVSLGITPGVYTPEWVYGAGAQAFRFRWDKPWGFPVCSAVALPLPWDQVFAGKWLNFITALGQRYAGNPALAMVKIQGVNAQTGELLLPHGAGGFTGRRRMVDCPPGDDVAQWQQLGYRPSKVLAAWRGYATAFARAFPRQKLVLDTGNWGMPGIDDYGRAIGRPDGDKTLAPAIMAAGAAALGEAFVVSNNGLGANWNWPRPAILPPWVALGYEAAAGVTGDRRCRMNGFMAPCDPHTVLSEAVRRALSARVSYLALYQGDLRNPAMADVVAEAHRELSPP